MIKDNLNEFEDMDSKEAEKKGWWNFMEVLKMFFAGIFVGWLFREEIIDFLIWLINLC